MVDITSISNSLSIAENGIWYSQESESISYPAEGNDTCFSVEDNSFWFRHRNACIQAVVAAFPPPDGGAIFDVGGGNGYVALGLEQAGSDVVLIEPGQTGAVNAKQRGLKNVICASTATAGLHQESLAAVGLFDVIEHIEDDRGFLDSIAHLLQGAGRLYATVPAYSLLWSREDIMAGHHRRYALGQITELISAAGFSIDFSTYIFRFLPVPTLLMRTIPYRLGLSREQTTNPNAPRDHVVGQGVVSRMLDYFLQAEVRCLEQKKPMPFGGSCLLVASRR
jgi:2-polyprenyl-3-methyl-5-hydroxy-6-metoxy-1,4-benzoquinol methylase